MRYSFSISRSKSAASLCARLKPKARTRRFCSTRISGLLRPLNVLFEAPFGRHLVFKGGTSLSKVWRAIRRFSEDIDITYDIRGFAPELVAGGDEEALPPTRSQERRWTRAIRPRLADWVRDIAGPLVQEELARAGFPALVRSEAERLYVGYEPLFEAHGIVRPEVQIDFGARSTGEPHAVRTVVCDAGAHLPDLAFPDVRPAVMLPERTFWEEGDRNACLLPSGAHPGESDGQDTGTTSFASTTPGLRRGPLA